MERDRLKPRPTRIRKAISRHHLLRLKPVSPDDGNTILQMASDSPHVASDALAQKSLTPLLELGQAIFQTIFEKAGIGIAVVGANCKLILTNPALQTMLGYSAEELATLDYTQITHPDDLPQEYPLIQDCLVGKTDGYELEKRYVCKDGRIFWGQLTVSILQNGSQPNPLPIAMIKDISDRKHVEARFQQQVERERLITTLTHHIRQSLDLDEILTTTVNTIRQTLQCDRVLVYRFNPDWSGVITVESVMGDWMAILGTRLRDPCFATEYVEQYCHGRIQVIHNVPTANLTPCHMELLESFQIQANLVVPILQHKHLSTWIPKDRQPSDSPVNYAATNLWGLLMAQQCCEPRTWESLEVDLLNQLATQVGIAIRQSELYQQVRQLNTNLEQQVMERTARLQQSLDFEAMLKRITDKVRDSLDEDQILQTVVEALAIGLGLDCCDTGIYNSEHTISVIRHEYTHFVPPVQGRETPMTNFPDIYHQLLQKQWLQFCPINLDQIRPIQYRYAILACPMFDNQGVMGDLWLFRYRDEAFNELEVRLVQQVANQCAIALRQARLYHAAQSQVTELERLNQLKDDFLCTVSHELRTPLSNINLATRMLETVIQQQGILDNESDPAHRYLRILKDECQREIRLIDDLLDLQRVEADTIPLTVSPIVLQTWLPHLTQPFEPRLLKQNQILSLTIPTTLPPLITDRSSLERILIELLNNACKYTPANERISISAWIETFANGGEKGSEQDASAHTYLQFTGAPLFAASITRWVCIQIANSGVEIPLHELPHIFEKFYRVPNADPWKYSGTGLGLALVKKLIKHLGGLIDVQSYAQQTQFTVRLPI